MEREQLIGKRIGAAEEVTSTAIAQRANEALIEHELAPHAVGCSSNPVSILNFLRLGLPVERQLSPDLGDRPLPGPHKQDQQPGVALRTLPVHADSLLRPVEESADGERPHTEEGNYCSLDIS